MKKSNLLMSAVILTSLVGGGTSVFAVEYDDEKAITDAEVVFEKTDGPIDPIDPENPDGVLPGLPTNPDVGDFGILYASDLDFGTQEYKGNKLTVNAKAIEDDESGDPSNVGRMYVPHIQTADLRGSDRTGWTLTAKLDAPFQDKDKTELKGAELKLSGLAYSKPTDTTPSATTGDVVLSTTAADLATATKDTGAGVHALNFGKLDADKEFTDGVTLTVPNGTVLNEGAYNTTVTYELVAEPATK